MNRKQTAVGDEQKSGKSQVTKKKCIFISWSKNYSRQIAIGLKSMLENYVFFGSGVKCFVSDVDIASGTDWWLKIKTELRKSGIGILCITKENIKEPWIYFESGALVGNNVDTIPLLISCDIKSLDHSPISGKQCIQFYEEGKFLQMINDINQRLGLLSLGNEQLNSIAREGYVKLKAELSTTLSDLKESRYFNEKYIYPSDVTTVKTKTVYISAPMSTLSDDEYAAQHKFLTRLKELLLCKTIGFSDVVCPAIDIQDIRNFDGNTKAIKENYVNLKQVEHMIIVYPHKLGSSLLMECGYGIALTKQIVIFYCESLPYMLMEAGETIQHVRTYKYKTYEDIETIIKSNGKTMFNMENPE